LRGRRNLDQVEAGRSGPCERIFRRQYAELSAVFVDHADLTNSNLIVNAQRSCYGGVSP
jgi:hypothetical protein